MPLAISAFTTCPYVGAPATFPCNNVVVVPALPCTIAVPFEITIDCTESAVPEFVQPLAIGNTFVTLVVRSIVPGVMSLLTSNPVERTPVALLCTNPAVEKAGNVIVFAELPIVTPAVVVPVLIFVAKFELLFRLTTHPDIVAPVVPVNNPADVTVPVPVVEMLPVVVTSSPAVVGESTVPKRLQYPRIPVVGGVEVNPLVPLV